MLGTDELIDAFGAVLARDKRAVALRAAGKRAFQALSGPVSSGCRFIGELRAHVQWPRTGHAARLAYRPPGTLPPSME